jgi:hypothetical protein
MQIIGAVKTYLGNPTYPVIITGKDIHEWLQNNSVDQIMFPKSAEESLLKIN